MKSLLVLTTGLAVVIAQTTRNSTTLPPQCETQCSSFVTQLRRCSTTTAPTNDEQWISTARTASTCICPVITADSQCNLCVMTNHLNTNSTKLFNALKASCNGNQQDSIAGTLLKLWGSTSAASLLESQARDNSTRTSSDPSSTTSSTSSKLPTATAKPNVGSSGVQLMSLSGWTAFMVVAASMLL